jgi:hypothetical protein
MVSFTTLLSYGSYLVIILLLLDKFFNGAGKIRKEVIETYKERNKQLEETNKSFQDQINQNGRDIARLSAIVEEKDKLILSLNQTILNRNPLLEKTLEENVKINKEIKEILLELKNQGVILAKKTDEQTVMIKSQVERDNSIDTSTDAEKGNVLRKEANN